MDRILSIINSIDLLDTADILAVSLLFFAIFQLLKESRSFTALRGLMVVILMGGALWVTARVAPLNATARLLERSLTLVVVIFVIIFQNELKKALTDFGQTSMFAPFLTKAKFDVEEIVKAVNRMSQSRVGALIAIERRNSLKPYAEVATQVNSDISSELIRTIFSPQTPLHDGAIIVQNNRIVAAGCLLPLSENPRLSKDLGTRHRAGIGLTEETDAVTVICSEETGAVSIAHDGAIERNLTSDKLRQRLRKLFEFEEEAESANE